MDMKKRIMMSVICFLTVFSTACCSEQRLKISLEPYSLRLNIFEPFIVRVTLTNIQKTSIQIPYTLGTDPKLLDFDIRNSDGKKISYITHNGDMYYPPDYISYTLKPRAKFVVWLNLSEGLTFKEPGSYSIKVRYNWNEQTVPSMPPLSTESKDVSFSIEMPTGLDAEALKLLRDPPTVRIDNLKEQEDFYRTFIRNYHQSTYAKYAHEKLAEVLDTIMLVDPTLEHSDAAIKEWRLISTEYKNFGFTDYAKDRIGFNYQLSNRTEEALKFYNILLSDLLFPDSLKIRIRSRVNDMNRTRKIDR